jgi:hypothetical protein
VPEYDKTPERMDRAELIAEVSRLRYERRLLGYARMVLDLVAACDESRWPQARTEAADLAQRIVDEIGHPVTDEPALAPPVRDLVARWRRDPTLWPGGAAAVLEDIEETLEGRSSRG